MTKRLKQGAIILSLIAVAALIGFRIFQSVNSEAPTGMRGGPGMRAQTVEIGTAERGSVSERITLNGALKAKEQVDVTPKMTGRVVRLAVDTGQRVARGSLLAVIEDDEIQQQVERSRASIAVSEASIGQRQAELANVQADMDRNRRLLDLGLISRQEFDSIQTRFQVAESQVELARAQRRQAEAELKELNIRLEQTRIHSPINGSIARRHVDLGAMVNPSTPIVTVVNVNTMVIHANAGERDIARVRPNSVAAVYIDSLPGQAHQGRVMRISPLLDPQTRMGVVEIEIDNRSGVLKGEMFARVEMDLGDVRETTLVPRDSLVYRGDVAGIFLLDGETAKFRAVETGLTHGDRVEVKNGVEVGEVVVTRGATSLNDGDRVIVAEEARAGSRPGGRQ